MFNALKYTEELEKAGFTREQAETSVKLVVDTMNENFATKSDLKELDWKMESVKNELEAKITSVKNELETKITSVKSELQTEIRAVKTELQSEIRTVETRLNTKIQAVDSRLTEMEYKLVIKLGSLIVFCTTLLGTVLGTMIKLIPASGH